jgi:hypothetical protein
MKMTDIFRQGDVLLVRIDDLPAGLKEAPRDKHGHIVLALGESSGHRHAIRDKNVTSFKFETAERDALSADVDYILVSGSSTKEAQLERRIAVLSVAAEIAMLTELDASEELQNRRREFVALAVESDHDSVLVNHEYVSGVRADHLPAILAPGTHKVIGQRVYTPKAIVRAVD